MMKPELAEWEADARALAERGEKVSGTMAVMALDEIRRLLDLPPFGVRAIVPVYSCRCGRIFTTTQGLGLHFRARLCQPRRGEP
jgi:hypothetical protein